MHATGIRLRAGTLGLLALAALAVALLTGGSGAAGAATATAAASKCGSAIAGAVPRAMKKLPAATQAYYKGYTQFDPLLTSKWANFKPKKKTGFTIGVSFNALINPFNAALFKEVQDDLKKSKAVSKIVPLTASSPTDIQGQVQQFNSLVQQKVDLIITLAGSGPAFTGPINAAAKAGIPTISLINDVQTPASVNISPNVYQNYAPGIETLINAVGQKGNVVYVQGIPGTATDTGGLKITKQLLAPCKNMKLIGQVVGNYIPPVVISATAQFLASHPQPIAAAFQTGAMAPYVMQGFQKAGRKVPPTLDVGAQLGSLAYWHDNLSKGYKGAGTAGGDAGLANEAANVAFRILGGQGPKFNSVLWYQPQITVKNLSTFYKSGSSLTTPGTSEGGGAKTQLPPSVMNSLFNHPNNKSVG